MNKDTLTQNGDIMPEAVQIPITGTLDLHTFDPREIGDLLFEYLHECLKRGIFEVTVIHGKGKGILRDRVHCLLSSWDFVIDYRLSEPRRGGWGSTVVYLKPPAKDAQHFDTGAEK